jgi:hypothetical protein
MKYLNLIFLLVIGLASCAPEATNSAQSEVIHIPEARASELTVDELLKIVDKEDGWRTYQIEKDGRVEYIRGARLDINSASSTYKLAALPNLYLEGDNLKFVLDIVTLETTTSSFIHFSELVDLNLSNSDVEFKDREEFILVVNYYGRFFNKNGVYQSTSVAYKIASKENFQKLKN